MSKDCSQQLQYNELQRTYLNRAKLAGKYICHSLAMIKLGFGKNRGEIFEDIMSSLTITYQYCRQEGVFNS